MRRLALWALVASCSGLGSASAQVDAKAEIEQLSAVLKAKPNDALLFYKRGELYRAQHEYAHALGDYAQAELLDPGLEFIYLSRGRVFYESARYPDAYRALTQFLQLAPGHSEALLFRARTRIRLGQHNAADLDFAEALANRKDPSAELFLERAANLSQAGKAGAAIAALEEGIARFASLARGTAHIDAPLAELQNAALAIELRARRFAQALVRIEAMLARSEHKEQLLARKAQILESAGDKAGAREVRRAALLQIAGLPETKRKLESTQKLAHELERLARADTARAK